MEANSSAEEERSGNTSLRGMASQHAVGASVSMLQGNNTVMSHIQ
jgi:hypothetical protein